MNTDAILALIADLYLQVQTLAADLATANAKVAELEAQDP